VSRSVAYDLGLVTIQGGAVDTGAGSAALCQYLERHAHTLLNSEDEVWSGIHLRFRNYLSDELPPRELVGSVRAMVFRGQEVLVVDHGSAQGLLVGGRPEPGESLVEALVREVAEETGWRVVPGPVVGLSHARRLEGSPAPGPGWNRPDPDFIDPFFLTEVVAEAPDLLQGGEPPMRFLALPTAMAVVHPNHRPLLVRALELRTTRGNA
jgi:8-oxo-dGTP pyrophosphatase MutT (NUDIX family)